MECKSCGEVDPAQFCSSHKTKCKRCVSAANNQRYHSLLPDAKDQYKNRAATWQDSNMLTYRWRSAKMRAAKSHILFDITEQDVVYKWTTQGGMCYYTGEPMKLQRDNNRASVSIDRIDASVGYTKENTVLCCSVINIMKNDLSVSELKHLVESLYVRRELY